MTGATYMSDRNVYKILEELTTAKQPKKRSKRSSRKRRVSRIQQTLNNLIIWSNIFFVFAAIVSFYGRKPLLGWIFFSIAVVSTVHHANWGGKWFWGKMDLFVAYGGTGIMILYGLWYLYINRTTPALKTRQSLMIGICGVGLFVVALVMCVMAKIRSTRKNHEFLLYHSLWHLLGGITGIFFAIFITSEIA